VGVPGSGKSTLMSELLKGFTQSSVELKPFKHVTFTNGVIHLGGVEAANGFPGTDTLSIAVHTSAVDFVVTHPNVRLFLGEGDRLGGMKFFKALEELGVCLHLYRLELSTEEQSQRLEQRNSKVNGGWLVGRRTKVNNVCQHFSHVRLDATVPISTNLHIIQELVIVFRVKKKGGIKKNKLLNKWVNIKTAIRQQLSLKSPLMRSSLLRRQCRRRS
jgi:hypothetical protein